MAVGMTFVIVDKDLDLSVGSTLGLVGDHFLDLLSPSRISISAIGPSVACCDPDSARLMGFVNGWLVTVMLGAARSSPP